MRAKEGEEEYAAWVGLDWADAKHDVCVRADGASTLEYGVIEHSPEAIAVWAEQLRTRFGGQRVAVCLELSRGPIVSALQNHDFIELFHVQPQTLAKYRQAFKPSHAKDDPSDARLALELLTKHRDKLERIERESVEMRTLQRLVEVRRTLVGDRVRVTNRITSALKCYFPQVLAWFRDKGTRVFCDFVERWPALQSAQRARPATLKRFFLDHNVRYRVVIDKRITAIRSATPLTKDDGVVVPNQILVEALLPQLRAISTAIARLDAHIAQLCDSHEDYTLFRQLPGAGDVYAARLLAAFGEQRDRYATASNLQRAVGIAPVTERSGKKCWVHWRYRCRSFTRQTFVEWAGETIPLSFWAGAFYRQQRDKGSSHHAALRSLAFKWLRILFRCWKDRTPYDETKYLLALKRRGSSLLKNIADNAATT